VWFVFGFLMVLVMVMVSIQISRLFPGFLFKKYKYVNQLFYLENDVVKYLSCITFPEKNRDLFERVLGVY